ncbi:hypothetical protein Daesc_000738 [Daldinia eschscholtzii]|uniref:Uncharacterized protein n=1 Tax=Daldinia eschscholtzii TaxID=292717 RepID=A0AAX6MZ76_9PEZI
MGMCQDCYRTTAAAVSMSLAMTNPELIWPHHQDQKRQAAQCQKSGTQTQQQHQQQQPQPQPDVKPSSASTYSGSTTYSIDKEKSQGDAKQKRSMRQRITETLKDLGRPSTEKSDRGSMSPTTEGRK